MFGEREAGKKKRELNELFATATENPGLAKELIEGMVQGPWSRSQASNVAAQWLDNLDKDYLTRYYDDALYKIWNFADSRMQVMKS